jgi:hypothetical protein
VRKIDMGGRVTSREREREKEKGQRGRDGVG